MDYFEWDATILRVARGCELPNELQVYRGTHSLAAQQFYCSGDPHFPPWFITEHDSEFTLWKDTDVGRVPFCRVRANTKTQALSCIARQRFYHSDW